MGFRRRQTVLIDNTVERSWMAGNYVRIDLIAGGAAGDHTVNGILPPGQPPIQGPGDVLVAVHFHNNATGVLTDQTGEFTITAPNVINNGGGTDSAAGVLVVVWEDRTP
jgi:hypothetical protein